MYDLVIRNGVVFDGSGEPGRRADVGVAGERIAMVGSVDASGASELDAGGMAVAPGFIDIHSHSDYTLLVDPRAVSSISQGVTTEIVGNCGFGCAPIRDPNLAPGSIYGFDGSVPLRWHTLSEYLDRLEEARPAVNVLALVPNGQLRRAAVGVADRAATVRERRGMLRALEESLSAGAFGYSTGLEYPAESGAPAEEIESMCRIVARRDRLYATHTRKRDEGAVAAIHEALNAARRTGVRLQISHLLPRKTDGGELEQSIAAVEHARGQGVSVQFDMHTRSFGFTFLSTLLPAWALAEGKDALRRHLSSKAGRERMKQHRSIINGAGWERVTLMQPSASGAAAPWCCRTVAEIAASERREPHDFCLDLLLTEIDTLERTMVLIFAYSEDNQERIFRHPLCMPGSDATALAPDGPLADRVFHGAYSWAAWFYRFMVRERRAMRPEEAVHRLTGMPASVLGLSKLGKIAVGARADLAVFDPDDFGERASVAAPNLTARGMRYVIVGGKVAFHAGEFTGVRAGEVLRA